MRPELIKDEEVYSKDLFECNEDYDKFREEYIEQILPVLVELNTARAKSEQEALYRRSN